MGAAEVIGVLGGAAGVIGAGVGYLALRKAGEANRLALTANEIAAESNTFARDANKLSGSANSLSAESNRIAYEANDIAKQAMEEQTNAVLKDREAILNWQLNASGMRLYPGNRNGQEGMITGWLRNDGRAVARDIEIGAMIGNSFHLMQVGNIQRLWPTDNPHKVEIPVKLEEAIRPVDAERIVLSITYTDDNDFHQMEQCFEVQGESWKHLVVVSIPCQLGEDRDAAVDPQ